MECLTSKPTIDKPTEDFSFFHCRNIRLDIESKEIVETYSSTPTSHSLGSLVNIIESEFAQLSTNTFTYELKPLSEKMSSSSSAIDVRDLPIRDYELTCRLTEIDLPVVPPLKMKLSVKYPNEPPEVLSLTSTSLSLTPARLENTGKWTLNLRETLMIVCFQMAIRFSKQSHEILSIFYLNYQLNIRSRMF